MNVFGVGPLEIIVILAVALIFVGPERLPKLAVDLARTIREIRRYTGRFAAEFNEVVRDLERETEPDRAEWKEIGQGLAEAAQPLGEELRAARADAERPEVSSPPSVPPRPDAETNGVSPRSSDVAEEAR